MKKINFLVLISLTGVTASIVALFILVQVPQSIKSENSILIENQEKKIEEQNAILSDLDNYKSRSADEITAIEGEIGILEKKLSEVKNLLAERNNTLLILDKEVSRKEEKIQKALSDIESATMASNQIDNSEEGLVNITYREYDKLKKSLEERKIIVLEQDEVIEQLNSALEIKEEEIIALSKVETTIGELVIKLEGALETTIGQLQVSDDKVTQLENALALTKEQLTEIETGYLSENVIKIENSQSKTVEDRKNINSNILKTLDGLLVKIEGFLTYDDIKSEINFTTRNGIKIPIRQDEFAGALVGSCGLPISSSIQKRCLVNIEAEIIGEPERFVLVGREIINIIKK